MSSSASTPTGLLIRERPGLSAIRQLYRPVTVMDLFAKWQASAQFAVDFNVDNLTDRYQLDPLALGVMPTPGRIMRLALTYRHCVSVLRRDRQRPVPALSLHAGLLRHGVGMQCFAEFIDDDRPVGIGLELFGEELTLPVVPVRCIDQGDLGR